ncbi:UDP-galactose transporter [Coemansia biformis]|uniref:UDP-galactose transporter homolog 1 n=1 Tax=Coemansia biformis TaxID=1286918 RepID=A0A9W7YD53_9FUNG|nr:UDP-galactose transporter [Coemansia biformis]
MLDFLVCVGGIYACFLSWSTLQERVTTATYGEDHQRFRFMIVLNALQAVAAALVGYLYIRVVQRKPMPEMTTRRWTRFFQVAFLNSIASPFGYMALRYINYPTMTLAKTCKMVPVLLMNKVLYRRHYPGHKYLVVAMVTAGVSAFMLFNSSSGSSGGGKIKAVENSLLGLLLVLVNLTIDGAVNSTQDQVFAEDKEISGQHMMCIMNLCSTILMGAWLLNPYNPELASAVRFLRTHPRAMVDIGLFAMCGALGQCFVFYTLATFGSLTLTTVTVTRKFLTILVSVFLNGHRLNAHQWSATGFVFAGISLDVYKKQAAKRTAAVAAVAATPAEAATEKPALKDAADDGNDSDALAAHAVPELVALHGRVTGKSARGAAPGAARRRRLVEVAV